MSHSMGHSRYGPGINRTLNKPDIEEEIWDELQNYCYFCLKAPLSSFEMPRSQLNESESLDDKIKRIRKKNEEIERRRLEVEADKQTAAKFNALVQLSAPKEDWPPPRSFTIIEEDKERPPNNSHENTRDRNRGNVTFDDSAYEGKKPPPDPAYRFLADDERDPLPSKRSSRYHQSPPRRGQAASRSRGRGNKINIRDNPPANARSTPSYEAWREERNRIDEERIRRQRTAQGQWRREWDSQKSESDWQPSLGEKSVEQHNPLHKSVMCTNGPSESPPKKLILRTKEEPKSENTRSASIAGKVPNFPSGTKVEPLLKNYFVSHKKSEEDTKPGLSFGKNIGKNAASSFMNQAHPMKIHSSPNESRMVQNSGNSLQISFGGDSLSLKAPVAVAQRRAGSGRLGAPPPPPAAAPPRRGGGGGGAAAASKSGAATAAAAAAGGGGAGGGGSRRADGLPQRRARRRIAPSSAQRKSSSTGDDSWEDADEHSEGEGAKAKPSATPRLKSALKTSAQRTQSATDQRAPRDGVVETSASGATEEEEEEKKEEEAAAAAAVAASSPPPEENPMTPPDDDSLPSTEDITASAQRDSSLGEQHCDTLSIMPNESALLAKISDTSFVEDNGLGGNEVEVDNSIGDLEEEYVLESPGEDLCLHDVVEFEGKSHLHDLHAEDGIEFVTSDSPTNNVSYLVESIDNVCKQVENVRVGGEENDTVPAESVSSREILEEESTCIETEAKTVLQDDKQKKLEAIGTVDKDQPTDLTIVESVGSEDAKHQQLGAENNAPHGKVSVQMEYLGDISSAKRKSPENLTCNVDDSTFPTEVTLLASKQSEDILQDCIPQVGLAKASGPEEKVISDPRAASPNTCVSVVTPEDKNISSNIDRSASNTGVLSKSQDKYSLENEVQALSEGPICSSVLESSESEIKCCQEKSQDCPNTNERKMSLPNPEVDCKIDDCNTSIDITKENIVID